MVQENYVELGQKGKSTRFVVHLLFENNFLCYAYCVVATVSSSSEVVAVTAAKSRVHFIPLQR